MAFMSPKLNGNSPDVFQLETSDTSGYAVDWHAHDCHMLLLPRRGGLFLSTESSPKTHVACQSFFLVPAEFAHATQATPGREEHQTLYVDPSYLHHQAPLYGHSSFSRKVARPGIWQGTDALDSILRLHDQLQSTTTAQDFQRQLPHLNHLLFQECARVIACQQASPQFNEGQQNALLVRDIQRYVREHLEAELNIESIAHEFHLSRRHLTRIFKAQTGETLLDFANRSRVEKASALISTTSRSILEVCLAVGLDSPSYLARLFKRYLGVTPSELRKRH
ncbi:AraC family transcriptional regulator [Pseudomonas abietaniphila]|uniref:AraC family transcriptional regulator n=1 Tax=Pseudomonas abietaniphila TaxID=89065 RepID=UPI003216431F